MQSSTLNRSLTTVAKAATIVFAGMIAGHLLGMVNNVLLGRFLGPENYGRFNIVLGVITIAFTLATFGLFGSLSRFIPYNLKSKNFKTVKSVIDFSLVFTFFISLAVAVALFVLSGQISTKVFHDPELQPLFKIFAIGIPVIAIQRIMAGVIRGFKEAKYDALIFKIGVRVIKIAIFLIFLTTSYRLWGAIFAFIASALVTVLVSIWLVRYRIFPDYRRYSRNPVARELLSFTWPLALTGFTFLFVSKTDTMLLGYFLTSTDVGIYTPALVIAQLLTFMGAAFSYIFLPVVSEFFANKNMEGLESLYKSTSKWMVLTVLPLLLFILLFPSDILRLLYGSSYSHGYQALTILSIGISMNILLGTTGNVLVGGGYTKLNLAGEVIAAMSNITLNIIMIPAYGIIGAAAATGASYLIRNSVFLFFLYRKLRIHPYKRNYLYILTSGALSAIVVFILKSYSPFSWRMTMMASGIILGVIYLLLVLVSRGIDQNDLVVMEAIERKLGMRLDFIKKYI